jgi:hypothetical protein
VVASATLYGLLYLFPPFLFGLLVLRINLLKTLHDIRNNAQHFVDGLGHLQILGIHIGEGVVSAISASGPGRWLLDGLHGLVMTILTHGLAALVVVSGAYCLLHVWAYLIASMELYRRLPVEVRRDPRGERLDFFSFR